MFNIVYVTGARADYGIVRDYLKCLNNNENIELSVMVTGAILDKNYGNTFELIEKDGFRISATVDIDICTLSTSTTIHSMAKALDCFGEIFEKEQIDLLIILGDRYEMMSVSIAAAMQRIPILHLHGGEITLGNYDDFIRHAITKMSTFHITSTQAYRRRVIQMGARPENVLYGGALGAENCKQICMEFIDEKVRRIPEKSYFCVLFHPETLTDFKPEEQVATLLSVIDRYIDNYKFVFIGSNADTGSQIIRERISRYCCQNSDVALYFESLSPDSFHYLVKKSCGIIGNSSSGLIEIPTLEVPTVNIGDRQKGRIRGNSVIDVKCTEEGIDAGIEKALSWENKNYQNPYYQEEACEKYYKFTMEILGRIKNGNINNRFYDISDSE